MKLKNSKSRWPKNAALGYGIAITLLVSVALIIMVNNRPLDAVKGQWSSSNAQSQREQTLLKEQLQRLETENTNLMRSVDELTQDTGSANYLLSGLIGPGRLLSTPSSTDWEPRTFRVPNGGSFTVATGCMGVRMTDKFTLTKINIDNSTRKWSVEIKQVNTTERATVNEQGELEDSWETTTSEHVRNISSEDPINITGSGGVIGSGTDLLLPTLVSPEAVYFVRTRYAC